ncbi:MinD/ParA family protein [Neobacillus sp. PS3-40]|uniref:MinD/ParA family protein n=1 Tax=Neobacillus sp. PS3-40 TaxID=3070679 RepID=UPI0027E19C11|nr:MinD/ParA family protein [Neobacillus sp. PS3-40]WML43720.1 MinD/ParA family protein [Neobacillus sp. PS3-40]
MRDQAENLRIKLMGHAAKTNTKAIAVVSGKGGVGKSNFSLNFSITLSKRGFRVLLFDMDVGMGNLDILMGRSSEKTIVDYLRGSSDLKDIIMNGPEGIKYIGGGTALSQLVEMNRLADLADELDTFLGEYDFLIFDMGAGVNEDSLKFLLSVHEIFVVTTPEPTSIMDAYSTMKYLHLLDPSLPFYIVANRVQSIKEGKETINRLTNVLKKFLDKEPLYLGVLPDDRTVQQAVKRQIPFITFNPKSLISSALEDLVNRYVQQKTQETVSYTSISFVSKLKKFLFER